MTEVLGDSAPSYQIIKTWSRDFKLGRETCKHAPGTGSPKTMVTHDDIDWVHNMILNDRRITVKFIAETYGFSGGSVPNDLLQKFVLVKLEFTSLTQTQKGKVWNYNINTSKISCWFVYWKNHGHCF